MQLVLMSLNDAIRYCRRHNPYDSNDILYLYLIHRTARFPRFDFSGTEPLAHA